MHEKSNEARSDARNVVADLLRKNYELRELLRYAFEVIEGFLPYKKRIFYPPGVEYSDQYKKIRAIAGGEGISSTTE